MTTGSVDIVSFVINFPFSQVIYYCIIHIYIFNGFQRRYNWFGLLDLWLMDGCNDAAKFTCISLYIYAPVCISFHGTRKIK